MKLNQLIPSLVMGLAVTFSTVEAANILKVGTNAEFAPYSFRDGKGIIGFDIDVINEVAKRLGKEADIKDMPFEAVIPDLVLGQVEVVAAGMTATEERAKRVAFTKPYVHGDPFVIFTRADSKLRGGNTVDALIGKTVVVNEGFTADLYLTSVEGIALVRLPASPDAFLAVASGRVDAFVTAQSTINAFLDSQEGSKYSWEVIEGTSENCALAVSKKYPKLLEEIQTALDEMEADSTLATLKAKWKLP